MKVTNGQLGASSDTGLDIFKTCGNIPSRAALTSNTSGILSLAKCFCPFTELAATSWRHGKLG